MANNPSEGDLGDSAVTSPVGLTDNLNAVIILMVMVTLLLILLLLLFMVMVMMAKVII